MVSRHGKGERAAGGGGRGEHLVQKKAPWALSNVSDCSYGVSAEIVEFCFFPSFCVLPTSTLLLILYMGSCFQDIAGMLDFIYMLLCECLMNTPSFLDTLCLIGALVFSC